MKSAIKELMMYWQSRKNELDRCEQYEGLHYTATEEYDMIHDTVEAMIELLMFRTPRTADDWPLRNQMEVWSWDDDEPGEPGPEGPTRLLVNMWCAGPDAMVDCLDPKTMHGWCCRADELYASEEAAEAARKVTNDE